MESLFVWLSFGKDSVSLRSGNGVVTGKTVSRIVGCRCFEE